jgi:hypothetical protein
LPPSVIVATCHGWRRDGDYEQGGGDAAAILELTVAPRLSLFEDVFSNGADVLLPAAPRIIFKAACPVSRDGCNTGKEALESDLWTDAFGSLGVRLCCQRILVIIFDLGQGAGDLGPKDG